ncbi:hypothetical protein N431DRAFT_470700 [Stipitochalara longipes BDJ]|nr:hypothetical protein N431DRAFT_470700 [Stipitochalara longipes BDJ]
MYDEPREKAEERSSRKRARQSSPDGTIEGTVQMPMAATTDEDPHGLYPFFALCEDRKPRFSTTCNAKGAKPLFVGPEGAYIKCLERKFPDLRIRCQKAGEAVYYWAEPPRQMKGKGHGGYLAVSRAMLRRLQEAEVLLRTYARQTPLPRIDQFLPRYDDGLYDTPSSRPQRSYDGPHRHPSAPSNHREGYISLENDNRRSKFGDDKEKTKPKQIALASWHNTNSIFLSCNINHLCHKNRLRPQKTIQDGNPALAIHLPNVPEERVFVRANGQHDEQAFNVAYLRHLNEVEASCPANANLDVWQDWNRWVAERRLWNQYLEPRGLGPYPWSSPPHPSTFVNAWSSYARRPTPMPVSSGLPNEPLRTQHQPVPQRQQSYVAPPQQRQPNNASQDSYRESFLNFLAGERPIASQLQRTIGSAEVQYQTRTAAVLSTQQRLRRPRPAQMLVLAVVRQARSNNTIPDAGNGTIRILAEPVETRQRFLRGDSLIREMPQQQSQSQYYEPQYADMWIEARDRDLPMFLNENGQSDHEAFRAVFICLFNEIQEETRSCYYDYFVPLGYGRFRGRVPAIPATAIYRGPPSNIPR